MVVIAFGIEGDCLLLVNPLGPVQLYKVMLSEPPVSCMVSPTQTGELPEAVAVGSGLTVILMPGLEHEQPKEFKMFMPIVTGLVEPAFQVIELLSEPPVMVPLVIVQL
jgi:hypothetical protein